MGNEERLLTVLEVALKLGVSVGHVYNLSHRGEIPKVKLGSCLRFRASDLAEWIGSQTVFPATDDEAGLERDLGRIAS